jgi:hypothetical protein
VWTPERERQRDDVRVHEVDVVDGVAHDDIDRLVAHQLAGDARFRGAGKSRFEVSDTRDSCFFQEGRVDAVAGGEAQPSYEKGMPRPLFGAKDISQI